MAVAARQGPEAGETAVLVGEIFAGRPVPPLPPSVAAALEQLHAARAAVPSAAGDHRPVILR